MVLRVEDLKHTGESVLKSFLGIKDNNFQLKEINTANEMKVGDFYRETAKRIIIPVESLERIYSTKYCRHFYSKEELKFFLEYWSGAIKR